MADHNAAVRLFVGTKKGLFRLHSNADRESWSMDGPHIEGYEVIHTCMSPIVPETVYAAVKHAVWGAHIYVSRDCGTTWSPLESVPQHREPHRGTTLKAIWYLTHTPDGGRMYAGIDPAGLFYSEDEGSTWHPVPGLNDHPTNRTWEPSRGIFAIHSVHIDPGRTERMCAAVSAGGVYRTLDGGMTWSPANARVRAENLPTRYPESGHNVHRVIMHPRQPDRLYRQCYNGTYRSDDFGAGWTEITGGLPSDFGYAIVTDPTDPDVAYQIPESGSHLRAVVDGKLRVFRTGDAGASWTSVSDGLPDAHAYVTVLREAMDTDRLDPCGLYFGTSGGHLFCRSDVGRPWRMLAGFLPRILTVKAVTVTTG